MKDKIKEEEKLYCLEPDGDESFVEGVVPELPGVPSTQISSELDAQITL